MKNIKFPNWVPQVEKSSKILIVGASGGIGKALVELLMEGPDSIIGFHRSSSENIPKSNSSNHKLIDLKLTLSNDEQCAADINGDGSIDVLDIVTIVQIIVS